MAEAWWGSPTSSSWRRPGGCRSGSPSSQGSCWPAGSVATCSGRCRASSSPGTSTRCWAVPPSTWPLLLPPAAPGTSSAPPRPSRCGCSAAPWCCPVSTPAGSLRQRPGPRRSCRRLSGSGGWARRQRGARGRLPTRSCGRPTPATPSSAAPSPQPTASRRWATWARCSATAPPCSSPLAGAPSQLQRPGAGPCLRRGVGGSFGSPARIRVEPRGTPPLGLVGVFPVNPTPTRRPRPYRG